MGELIELELAGEELLVVCPYCDCGCWELITDKINFTEITAMRCTNPDCEMEYDIEWSEKGLVIKGVG